VLDYEPLRWIAFIIDLSERQAREEHARELVHELSHRTKNLISVIQGIAHLLAQKRMSLDEFHRRLSDRLQALAGIQNVVLQDNWRGAPIRELVLSQLAHCADLVGSRIFLGGAPLSLTATACQYLGMALFELCTNALKYGALSDTAGTVTIRWTLETAPYPERLRVEWIETGGPRVKEPDRQGFGHRVTTDIVARALGGSVSDEFREEGLHWRIILPPNVLLGRQAAPED
jgi:two-component sensor histidine kinase